MAKNEVTAVRGLPVRVRSMEGLGLWCISGVWKASSILCEAEPAGNAPLCPAGWLGPTTAR